MPLPKTRPGSLVLYKKRPARVEQIGQKLKIEQIGGQTLNVRPKDVDLLHPGPVGAWPELAVPAGEVETAWEILAGTTTRLAELAELVYGHYSPATAWASWQLVDDGLYFHGSVDRVEARPAEDVARIRAAREVKEAETQAWAEFVDRVRQQRLVPDDSRFLGDVEDVAYGRQNQSRLLRELGWTETPETAHRLLLDLHRWDHTRNPYPARQGVTTVQPEVELPALADETRLDLTHLPAFAIDDEGTRDPDDALSLDGNRLWVHVADVSALVLPDSPADLEARARGANLYLPEETIAMLPRQATQSLGLGLADISPALSFGLILDLEGEVLETEIRPSWVRVQRLTYEEVEERLESAPFRDLLGLAQGFEARRRANGAIEINLPEVKVLVVDGQVSIRPILPLRSRALVREAMLMAGQAVARFALQRDLPFPFTSQDPPDRDQPLPPPEGLAEDFALRRSLRPGQVRSIPGPHAGLGLEVYAQVTSPLRRYLDLVAHQQLRAFLSGQPLLDEQQLLARVGAAEAMTGAVRRAERLARKHWTLVYLQSRPDWRGQGVLVERRGPRGVFLIPELDLEVQVPLRRELAPNSVVPLQLKEIRLSELELQVELDL